MKRYKGLCSQKEHFRWLGGSLDSICWIIWWRPHAYRHFTASPHTYLCLGVSVCGHPACDDCSWAVEAQSCQQSVKVESWLSSWRGHKQHKALPISFPWGQGKDMSRTSYCRRHWEETTQRKHLTTITLSHHRTRRLFHLFICLFVYLQHKTNIFYFILIYFIIIINIIIFIYFLKIKMLKYLYM